MQELQQKCENLAKQMETMLKKLETTQNENKTMEQRLSEIETEKENEISKFLKEMIKNKEDNKVAVQSVEAERDNCIDLFQCGALRSS